ncbi:uncharacterized protein PITG_04953 [Phytophthora infestans T30-4]|uniref:Uncharacterized protein n=1 Tax=Phytophthora infestans (strain T30-4) TaxID=403677 RepID=D0N2F9_PHYIT|nr:uncharacterized protein PITG_04953 [Phytophthora infestans T30-4]EEY68488.1 conserved hypothetical protein [Phytophthora infestans T30-4]|eukprot:XP_002905647.1 conserved hypothetical protein [Phytophthora infestans T30-4]
MGGSWCFAQRVVTNRGTCERGLLYGNEKSLSSGLSVQVIMTSTLSLFAAIVAAVTCFTQVQAHGYMLLPLTEFKGTPTGAWIVQIAPQFQANWESVRNDEEVIALYVEKAKEAGYANNIRKLLDSDTNLYGAHCGFSNPDAKPKDPPKDGTATFVRGLAHHRTAFH